MSEPRDPAELWVVLRNGDCYPLLVRPALIEARVQCQPSSAHVTAYVPKSDLDAALARVAELDGILKPYLCSDCSGRGWHVGECHPRETCGSCDGTGLAITRLRSELEAARAVCEEASWLRYVMQLGQLEGKTTLSDAATLLDATLTRYKAHCDSTEGKDPT